MFVPLSLVFLKLPFLLRFSFLDAEYSHKKTNEWKCLEHYVWRTLCKTLSNVCGENNVSTTDNLVVSSLHIRIEFTCLFYCVINRLDSMQSKSIRIHDYTQFFLLLFIRCVDVWCLSSECIYWIRTTFPLSRTMTDCLLRLCGGRKQKQAMHVPYVVYCLSRCLAACVYENGAEM